METPGHAASPVRLPFHRSRRRPRAADAGLRRVRPLAFALPAGANLSAPWRFCASGVRPLFRLAQRRGDLQGGDLVALAAQHLEAVMVEDEGLAGLGNG